MNFSNKHKIKNFLHVPTLKRFQLGNPTLIPRFQLGNPKMIKSRHIALSTLVQENQDGSTMAPRQWLPFPGKGLGNLIQFHFNFYLLVQVLAWYNGPPHFMAPRWIHDCLLPTNDARHRSSTTQGSRLAFLPAMATSSR